jgi:CMP/dCMP kinase
VIVAIDGPAGAGKGTVARALADELGWRYVDTGAMYRAIALALLQKGADLDDAPAAEAVARSSVIELAGDRVLLDGVDVGDRIRMPEVTRAVSSVSAHPGVRAALVARQRELMSGSSDVVMEGRDIGTTVAPDADVKIFLTASPRERARRRARQLDLDEDASTLAAVERAMVARDDADATRAASPFRKAPDAVVVDSTSKSIEDVVQEVASIVRGVRDERGA